MITSIKSNVRAKNRELTFTKPIVFITGDNKSGKTSILDAITLILLGYLPRLGKTGEKLSNILGWSAVCDIVAKVTMSGEESIRKFRLSGNKEDGYTKKAEKQAIGTQAFDAQRFLNSGPTERIAIIQESLGATIGSSDGIAKSIKAKIENKLADMWVTDVRFAIPKGGLTEALDLWKDQINALIKNSTDQCERYAGSTLTNMEMEQSPPSYDKAAHQRTFDQLSVIGSSIKLEERELAKITASIQLLKDQIGKSNPADKSVLDQLSQDIAIQKEELTHLYESMQAIEVKPENKACGTCGQTIKCDHIEQSDEWHAINSKAMDCISRIEDLESKLSELTPSIEVLAMTEKVAKYQSDEASMREAIEQLESDYTSLEQELQAHIHDKSLFDAYQAAQEQKNQVVEAMKVAENTLNAMKVAKEILVEEYKACTEKVLGPVMGVANQLLTGILDFPLTHRGFNLGYQTKEHVWVPLEGFSGSELGAATIAFSAALASTSSPKIAILDEVGVMGDKILGRFIMNLEQAVKHGTLDQVFLAGVRVDPEENELIQVIEL
jgi:DNA repair exonuclease SbcCD ATPase subunit